MMTCREVVDFLMDYLSGSLAAAERREFERHLEACPPCVSFLKTYERTVALGKEAFSEPDSSAQKVPGELVKAILAAKRKR